MTVSQSKDSMKCLEALAVGDKLYTYYSLKSAEKTLGDLNHLPRCVKVLLENLIRHEDTVTITVEDMRALTAFHALRKNPPTVLFNPSRTLVSGGPAISVLTDLAAFKDALIKEKDDPFLFSPACPADVVIDTELASTEGSKEKIDFLRWGQQAFANIRLVPPGKGSSDAINTDFLTSVVHTEHTHGSEATLAYPDTVIGGGRLPRAGGLGVLAWPSEALDIEAVLLGTNLPLTMPGILGIKVTGKRPKTVTATDIAIALLKAVRQNSGSGKFIEFYGQGLDYLSAQDRMVIADLLGEAGVFSVYFPIDQETLSYLVSTGRPPEHVTLVEAYAKAQGLWRESWPHDLQEEMSFTGSFEFNLDALRHNLGGPGLAYNLLPLTEVHASFAATFPAPASQDDDPLAPVRHGDLIWALIGPLGSATHPLEMIAAGLTARKAREHGLRLKPWVRAVLHIPSIAIQDILSQTGLLDDLESIGFFIVKEGDCAPPIQETISETIAKKQLVVCGMSSGSNKEFTPFHPLCSAGYLASPSLVVAYALAGNLGVDLAHKAVAQSPEGRTTLLKDVIPTAAEVTAIMDSCTLPALYEKERNALYEGDAAWKQAVVETGPTYTWAPSSTHIKRPSCLDLFTMELPKLKNLSTARALAVLGSDIPAADIAPSGPIEVSSQAGQHLLLNGVQQLALGVYEGRYGNEDVMVRGAFKGNSLVNALTPGAGPGLALHPAGGQALPFFDIAARYRQENTPVVLFAGQNYGHGIGQEWAAKATRLLGISIVVAEGFAPEHRLNLIRTGVLPLQLKTGVSLSDLELTGKEILGFAGLTDLLRPPAEIMITINHVDKVERYMLLCRLDTEEEMETYRHGSLWAETLRNLIMLAI